MANKILVALDNSAMSQLVFEEALAIAKASESHLRVLHVVPLGKATIQDSPGHLGNLNPFLFDQDKDSTYEEHLFHEHVSKAIRANIHTEFFQYVGDPGQIICNFALVWEADLIVVGRRDHSCMSEMLMGSVSDYIVHHAPCSVHILNCLDRTQPKSYSA